MDGTGGKQATKRTVNRRADAGGPAPAVCGDQNGLVLAIKIGLMPAITRFGIAVATFAQTLQPVLR